MRRPLTLRWLRISGATALAMVLTVAPLTAADLSRYRDYALGSRLEDVLQVSRARPLDVVTVHEEPNRIQTLEWRTPYTTKDGMDVDPVRTITFSFIDGQLYEMRVEYDRNRTDGMTTEDLVAGVTEVYGPATPSAGPRRPRTSVPAATTLAVWQDASSSLDLARGPYGGLHLVVQSVALEARARVAIATAVARHAAEEPARLLRAKADAAATVQEERARNKAGFRP